MIQLFFATLVTTFLIAQTNMADAQSSTRGLGTRGGSLPPPTLVSVSYQNLVRCFPDLQKESLQKKLDLTELNDFVRTKWAFVSSDYQLRQIEYVGTDGQTYIAKIKYTPRAQMKPLAMGKPQIQDSRIELFLVGKDGARAEVKDLSISRVNPSTDEINSLSLGGRIIQDRLQLEDSYATGQKVFLVMNQKRVSDLVISDSKLSKKLSCELSSGDAVLCSCQSK